MKSFALPFSVVTTVCLLFESFAADTPVPTAGASQPHAVEQAMFGSLQGLKGERSFGQLGVTGLKLRIYEGLALTVEDVLPGTPAAGKFTKGQVLERVNGVALAGKNPFIVLGSALTAAEASDGVLVIEVKGEAPAVRLQIPVLGAYSATWPLECKKSQTIVERAAAYYAATTRYPDGGDTAREEEYATHGVGGALATLFLLSTGDDQYLPRVKRYVDHLSSDVSAIGDQTWNNGYNGIVCAEYYLRTGDTSALPAIQYYCDNAKERQFFGVGWGHWGRSINPRYVGGGLMNPAGAQVATSLLLAKACGADVDEATMLGALRQWYRFAGHGTVPYGDHRGEGGLGSNGKDGMAAAMMQAAMGASGDVGIYRKARDYFSMSTLTSYPKLVQGHADNGRGDGIWRGIASAYMLDVDAADYHAVMNHLRWWFDLSRRPGGGIGMATATRFDDVGSGAGLALAYTAPRKTLCITGAPRSPYAKAFALPARIWGREADLAFLSLEHGAHYGLEEPIHVPFGKLGNAYGKGAPLESIPQSELLKNVYHKRYVIRAQAAKALQHTGAYAELEKLLHDADPRVRRAALDGMTDYRYWFAMGKEPIASAQVTTGMVAAIRGMLSDEQEAFYVVDGALMALSRAPAPEIVASLPLIRPWTTHADWWLRQSAFLALNSAVQDAAQLPAVLPMMIDMMVAETRTQARQGMHHSLARLLKTHVSDPLIAKQISTGFQRAVRESVIQPGVRSGEGAYNVIEAASVALRDAPSSAVEIGAILEQRFGELETPQIASVVKTLLTAQESVPEQPRAALSALLYDEYRTELIRRMEAEPSEAPLDTILALTQLRSPDVGWQAIGVGPPAERVWRFTSFEPQAKDQLHPREGKRFRDVSLPAALEGWLAPDFDATDWSQGQAPVGKGVFKHKHKTTVVTNASAWGEGEFLLMRSTFELAALDFDYYRLSVLANQGFRIHLNGHPIHTYIWWKDEPFYRRIGLGPDEVKHLKTGTNHLAVYANAAYKEGVQVAQIDVYLEGLKKTDLLAGK